MIRMGIVGLGYWGPNLLRVVSGLPDCEITALCDINPQLLRDFQRKLPSVKLATTCASEVFSREVVDAVIIATPTKTHFALAAEALGAGLHCFVEKPLATSAAECDELIALADSEGLSLCVGHVFLYSAPVAKLKEMVDNGDLGTLYYMSSTRRNLGPVRHDVSALWDLAPHDVSIMLDLMGCSPLRVSCNGLAYLSDTVHDVCVLSMHFPGNCMGTIHVSWLDPNKKREMTIVGSRKMVVYNDIDPLEKIKVFDHGVEKQPQCESFGDVQCSYRYGDTYSPRIQEVEPLKAEMRHFLDGILLGRQVRTDGRNGRDVVRVIEAADYSLHQGCGEVELGFNRRPRPRAARAVVGSAR
jgi:predicted dehydrogenase